MQGRTPVQHKVLCRCLLALSDRVPLLSCLISGPANTAQPSPTPQLQRRRERLSPGYDRIPCCKQAEAELCGLWAVMPCLKLTWQRSGPLHEHDAPMHAGRSAAQHCASTLAAALWPLPRPFLPPTPTHPPPRPHTHLSVPKPPSPLISQPTLCCVHAPSPPLLAISQPQHHLAPPCVPAAGLMARRR